MSRRRPAKGATKVHDIVLLGRQFTSPTRQRPTRDLEGELVKPEKVERYLTSKFGDALDTVRNEMERLAHHFRRTG